MSETKREYAANYRKPPMHTRFKKGQSGNPRGRPKKDLPALLVAAFLVLLGAPWVIAFALLQVPATAITKGTLPLALFGPQGYGWRSGCCPPRLGRLKQPRHFCLACFSTGWESGWSACRWILPRSLRLAVYASPAP
jgi:Family of unknown function (DUF5681)